MSWEIYELRRLAASDLRFMSLGQFIDQLELIDEIRPRHDVAYALRPVADVADPVADEGAPVLVPADPPAHFADVADLGGGGGRCHG
ncbi:MAG: hypothetical protein Q4G36_08320 [Paracoccus sp. (in: a-proteobacteria)]|nr:hypothetical protein [Paracoccus sp. (in: a-proteobacteria)]